MRPTKETKDKAREKGLAIVTLKLDGRFAKTDSVEVCGTVGPETLEKVRRLLFDTLLKSKERDR